MGRRTRRAHLGGAAPDITGGFAATAEPTPGAANICPGEIAVAAWPGSDDVRVLDEAPMFLEDSSGLDVQETEDGTVLRAVENGTGTFWKLNASADGSVSFADGWTDGKRVRFQKDAADAEAAGPDTEGITVGGDGLIYVASERDNSDKGVNLKTILQVDPSEAGPDLVALTEWDLTDLLPAVGAEPRHRGRRVAIGLGAGGERSTTTTRTRRTSGRTMPVTDCSSSPSRTAAGSTPSRSPQTARLNSSRRSTPVSRAS